MYLVIRTNKTPNKKAYLSLDRLFKVEGIDKSYKSQIKSMLNSSVIHIGNNFSIEKIELDDKLF